MNLKHATLATFLATGLLVACSGGGSTPNPRSSGTPTATPTPGASGTTPTPAPSGSATPAGLPAALEIHYPLFYGQIVASFATINPGFPRGLVALPNGDLLIGTGSAVTTPNNQVYILPNADGPSFAGTLSVFATLTDGTCGDTGSQIKDSAQGVAFAPNSTGGTIFVAMECGVFKIPYTTGDRTAESITEIVPVRQGPITNLATDGDVHHTTSLTVSGTNLYIGVGSSCNACAEVDLGRAAVLRTNLSGGSQVTIAKRFRNPLALAVSPSGTVWAGGAGQDCAISSSYTPPATPPPTCVAMDQDYFSDGHPFEFIDPVSKRYATNGNSTVDYYWPVCEENLWPVINGSSCSGMFTRLVQAPAYATLEGATFYPKYSSSAPAYAFPSAYQGGLFFTLHGSWHESSAGIFVAVPAVVYVPMTGDTPVNPQKWGTPGQPGGFPYSTWGTSDGNPTAFLDGFQDNTGARIGRPTGIAVGPNGSVFIADDTSGNIYRIRYGAPGASAGPRGTMRYPGARH
jgi:glucose/arabinose dehydrogenase